MNCSLWASNLWTNCETSSNALSNRAMCKFTARICRPSGALNPERDSWDEWDSQNPALTLRGGQRTGYKDVAPTGAGIGRGWIERRGRRHAQNIFEIFSGAPCAAGFNLLYSFCA